ncbi:MAG: helix-turn-helix domain-containing protein [Solirubrobacteraceae bacterium]
MADIGARLREARMRAQVDINEVEARTKIRAKYLRALENEEWDLLPGEVYVKSFLRTYGAFLGLDTRQLLDDFKRQYEAPSDHELRPIAPLARDRERDRGPRGPRIPAWLAIAVVLIGVVVVLYFVGRNPGNKTGTNPTTHAVTGAKHRGQVRHRVTRRKAARVKLQLIPTGQVYVCLVDGHGKRLIPGLIFAPGQTIPVKTGSKLLLTLGNSAVQMKVNGIRVPVSPSPGSIGYEFQAGSHRILPAAQQPRCA